MAIGGDLGAVARISSVTNMITFVFHYRPRFYSVMIRSRSSIRWHHEVTLGIVCSFDDIANRTFGLIAIDLNEMI